jgi:nucleoside-diphosphate-sugar epimerase
MKVKIEPKQYIRYSAEYDYIRIRNERGWSPRYLYEKVVEDYIETVRKGNSIFEIYK